MTRITKGKCYFCDSEGATNTVLVEEKTDYVCDNCATTFKEFFSTTDEVGGSLIGINAAIKLIRKRSKDAHADLKLFETDPSRGGLWDKYADLCHATVKLLYEIKIPLTIVYDEESNAKAGSLFGENTDQLRWTDSDNYIKGINLSSVKEIRQT